MVPPPAPDDRPDDRVLHAALALRATRRRLERAGRGLAPRDAQVLAAAEQLVLEVVARQAPAHPSAST